MKSEEEKSPAELYLQSFVRPSCHRYQNLLVLLLVCKILWSDLILCYNFPLKKTQQFLRIVNCLIFNILYQQMVLTQFHHSTFYIYIEKWTVQQQCNKATNKSVSMSLRIRPCQRNNRRPTGFKCRFIYFLKVWIDAYWTQLCMSWLSVISGSLSVFVRLSQLSSPTSWCL